MINQWKKVMRETKNKIKDKIPNLEIYIALAFVILFLLFVGYEYYVKYFYIVKNPKKIKRFITSYGSYSIIIFIGLQILQVVAFFIPGEIVQVAGGYIYGTFIGTLLSIIGITLGSSIVYFIAHILGKPLVEKIIPSEKVTVFQKILNAGSKKFVVLLLYLIPGIPKDILGYICGISNISFGDFIIYSTLGRIPGVFISAYFGYKVTTGEKGILITITIVMSILFLVGLVKGEKIVRGMIRKKN